MAAARRGPSPGTAQPDSVEPGTARPDSVEPGTARHAPGEPLQVDLPDTMCDAVLDHCRRELPNEACGLIAGDAPPDRGGKPVRWLPARNALASPYRYELHPDDLVRVTLDIDDAGQVVWAIVHSHVASPAVPSATDVREWRYPGALQIVVSVRGKPEIRAWRVGAGLVEEVPVMLH